jgi:hypothetical protein
MESLPVEVPRTALYDLTALFVPPETPTGTVIELVIVIEDERINVREFGAYLSLADRVYGRMTRAGLMSYSHRTYGQLEISEIRKNSIELYIKEVISGFQDATPLVILWLFLKHLPSAIKTLSESSKNFADAFKSYEEASLARENRKRLRAEIRQDEELQKLGDRRLNQVVVLLDALQAHEGRRLAAPVRFAQKYVKSLILRIRKDQ